MEWIVGWWYADHLCWLRQYHDPEKRTGITMLDIHPHKRHRPHETERNKSSVRSSGSENLALPVGLSCRCIHLSMFTHQFTGTDLSYHRKEPAHIQKKNARGKEKHNMGMTNRSTRKTRDDTMPSAPQEEAVPGRTEQSILHQRAARSKQ